MNENVKVVFGLIGGLALFLYGMNSMSDALQKAAGERMKKILGFLTRNPIMGAVEKRIKRVQPKATIKNGIREKVYRLNG